MNRRALAVLLALLVVAVPGGGSSLPATGLDASATPATGQDGGDDSGAPNVAERGQPGVESVRRLGIPDDQLDRTGEVWVGPNVGAALSTGSSGLRAEYDALLVREQYHTADSRLARQNLLSRRLDAVDRRATRLHELEAEAIRRYASGDLSERDLLHALGRIHFEATRLRAVVETVRVLAAGLPSDSLVARTEGVDVRLATLQGPARERIAAAISGADPAARVHVEASETGLVLGVLENETYVREATRLDHRDGVESDPPLTVGVASQRAIGRYPRAFDSSRSSNIDVLGADVFQVVVRHQRGSVTGYVDGSTGLVFREYQRQHVSALPAYRIATVGSTHTRLVLERTYPGGPLLVTLANESRTTRIEPLGPLEPPDRRGGPSGSMLDGAVVIVGNETVGRTGPDGTLWVVEPRAPYTLTAIHGSTMVNVSIDPRLALSRTDA